MSWSVNFIGKPENIIKALENESEKLSGQSKTEYDSVLPHIKALVNANHSTGHIIKIIANGHAWIENDVVKNSNCSVSIEPIYGALV